MDRQDLVTQRLKRIQRQEISGGSMIQAWQNSRSWTRMKDTRLYKNDPSLDSNSMTGQASTLLNERPVHKEKRRKGAQGLIVRPLASSSFHFTGPGAPNWLLTRQQVKEEKRHEVPVSPVVMVDGEWTTGPNKWRRWKRKSFVTACKTWLLKRIQDFSQVKGP